MFFICLVFFVATTNSFFPLSGFLVHFSQGQTRPPRALHLPSRLDWLLSKPAVQLSSDIPLCQSPELIVFLNAIHVVKNVCFTQKVAFYTYILFCTLIFLLNNTS